MILTFSTDHVDRLTAELRRARKREIGGVLVGEHLSGDCFALVDFSVQRRGGGRARFRRDPVAAAKFVDRAIAVRGGDPRRVNYLGEWHSHPGCAAVPSGVDVLQMRAIVDDPDNAASFAVLVIVRLEEDRMAMSATLFRRGMAEETVALAPSAQDQAVIAPPSVGPDQRQKETQVTEQSDA